MLSLGKDGVWRRAAGFTLLEMAIVLAIIGLMTGYMLVYTESEASAHCLDTTQRQLAELRGDIDRFVAREGRYPRPASRNLRATDPAYAVEATGPSDPSIDRIAGAHPLLVGALPAATLGISPEQIADCWGNKLTYAVTESQTSATGYTNPASQGGIDLRRGTLDAPVNMLPQVSYVLLSHGPDGLGATPRSYHGPTRHCNAAQADLGIRQADKENCDLLNPIFYTADYNDGDVPANRFDDVVLYGVRPVLAAAPTPPSPPAATDCQGGTISWGGNCAAPALLTLAGLSVTLTNTNSGYTGVAVSTCTNGTRTTLGTCLPVGTCSGTSPRGGPLVLLTGVSMRFGTGICKQYHCCSGAMHSTSLFPCPLVDLPGLASCP